MYINLSEFELKPVLAVMNSEGYRNLLAFIAPFYLRDNSFDTYVRNHKNFSADNDIMVETDDLNIVRKQLVKELSAKDFSFQQSDFMGWFDNDLAYQQLLMQGLMRYRSTHCLSYLIDFSLVLGLYVLGDEHNGFKPNHFGGYHFISAIDNQVKVKFRYEDVLNYLFDYSILTGDFNSSHYLPAVGKRYSTVFKLREHPLSSQADDDGDFETLDSLLLNTLVGSGDYKTPNKLFSSKLKVDYQGVLSSMIDLGVTDLPKAGRDDALRAYDLAGNTPEDRVIPHQLKYTELRNYASQSEIENGGHYLKFLFDPNVVKLTELYAPLPMIRIY